MMPSAGSQLAIVGMACCYPDARSPSELWENVVAQRRAFRRLPVERLRLADYWSSDPGAPDHTYATEAALIAGYEFDRVGFRVAGATFRSTDLAHWLALDVAAQALADAGYPDGEHLPKASTGVLVGNTLTGEFSRANVMRLRWPYVRRVVEAALVKQGWSQEQLLAFLQKLEEQYKSPFPPIGEETLAGSLSNTIAGRICNHFDLKGGGYTVDGACASSLLAITTACTALIAGDLDVAIAGGVDLSLDPFELVGFAKAGALATEEMRVFDAHSAGFWPGEGCGFVVLMRHADALAQRRRIYALIQGWGVSSDGSGGITRPEVEGQYLAIQRAYRRAGFGMETVAYFEGHGTGTAVGDATELRALSLARNEQMRRVASDVRDNQTTLGVPHSYLTSAVVGSIKANIGHTKAAAGVAGLIKAVMALYTQILPPTTGCQVPHPEFNDAAAGLRVLPQAERWSADVPLRAGVSAMGFGGINTHVVLERTIAERGKTFSPNESLLRASAQDTELFLLSANTSTELQQQVEHLLRLAPDISRAELADLAATLQRTLVQGHVRAAVVVSSPAELTDRLQWLQSWLIRGTATQLDFSANVFLGTGHSAPRLGFLFPGQGTPVYKDGGALGRRFAWLQELYTEAGFTGMGDSVSTAVAQPAVVTATLAALRVLNALEIKASIAVGHSLGELSALHWAGVLDEQALRRIAVVRGRLMAKFGSSTGTMAHIGADSEAVQMLLNGSAPSTVTVACLNSPKQTVIAGETTAVTKIVARARDRGLHAGLIPVSHAFHSSLMAATVQPLAEHLVVENFHPLRYPVVSTVTGDFLRTDEDLRALLYHQITTPVHFMDAVAKAAQHVDLLIEVGPGQVLRGLTVECVDTPVVAIDAGGSSLQGLLQVAGATFALGVPVNHSALFADRFTRPFNLDWRPRFFGNPCELAPVSDTALLTITTTEPASITPVAAEPLSTATTADTDRVSTDKVLALVRQLVAERAELPLAAIRDSDRLLSELHLNSISVSQLVAAAARRLNLPSPVAPTEFANVTVATVAQTLAELIRKGNTLQAEEERGLAPGVDSWVHAFTVELVERPLPRRSIATELGSWKVIVPAEHVLAPLLQQAFAQAPGAGVVVCLPPHPNVHHLSLLLEGVQMLFTAKEGSRFILVQHSGGAAAVARTLHLEDRNITTCVVNIPLDPQVIAWVIAEATTAVGYTEVHYDANGQRYEPVLRRLPLDSSSTQLPLGTQDVLLVTGGGKGITAECAFSLARATGVRLALLGRSRPEQDAELSANLARMRLASVDFRYLVADITCAEEVDAAVQEVESTLGAVTGILHGAASNVPQLLRSLDMAAFQHTMAPKLQGANHLLAAIKPDQLRLFVTFGSIIARTGLPGEADYGLANEWLVDLTERFQHDHPSCRCLAIEWSVWAGAGMGDRLGRLDTLMRQGITPIPLDEGVAMLHRLLAHNHSNNGVSLPTSLVVTGRIGGSAAGLPTLRIEQPDLPFLRFVEEVRVYYPGVELVVDAKLSTDTDPYLADHIFRGERLLPAVMGLEAMAQVAMAVVEAKEPPVFEQVRFERPVVVPEGGTVTIRIAALVRTANQVEIVLRCEETAFQIDHFRATCQFGERNAEELSATKEEQLPSIALDPDHDLYDKLLFQRGRFQRIKSYQQLTAKACRAEIITNETAWFGRYLPAELVLGDPGARDATIHALQVCVPHATLLPIGIERLTPSVASKSGPRFIQAQERSYKDGTFIYDIQVTNTEGCIIERWQGLHLRAVVGTKFVGPWPAPLLAPYLERKLEELLPDTIMRIAVEINSTTARRDRSNQAFQSLLGPHAFIQRRLDGRPETTEGLTISAAHAGDIALAVGGKAPLGCDLEFVVTRAEAMWRDLLGVERFKLAKIVAEETQESLDMAATRIWSASECLKKAGGPFDAPLMVTSLSTSPWIVLSAGTRYIVTAVVELAHQPQCCVLAVLGQL